MTRSTPRDLARRLRDTPAGEPPADLLARLRAEIPPRLELAAEPPRGASRRLPPPWLRAAAVVMLALGGAWMLWRLSVPVLAPQAAVEEAPDAAGAGGRAPEAGESARSADAADAADAGGDFTGDQAQAAVPEVSAARGVAAGGLAAPEAAQEAEPKRPSARGATAVSDPEATARPLGGEVAALVEPAEEPAEAPARSEARRPGDRAAVRPQARAPEVSPPPVAAPPTARPGRGAPTDATAKVLPADRQAERRESRTEAGSAAGASAPFALHDVAPPTPPAPRAQGPRPRRAAAAPAAVPAYARLTNRIDAFVLDGERRAAGAEISLVLPDGSARRGVTGADGQLRFGDLEAGRYLLRAPAAAGAAPAIQTIEIPGGRTTTARAVLQIADVTPVRVVVRDEGRVPLPGATVHVTPSAAPPRTAGAQGRLDLDLVPGRYRLVASLEGFADRVVEIEVPAGGGGAPLQVEMSLPTALAEHVVVTGGGHATFTDEISVVGKKATMLRSSAVSVSIAGAKPAAEEPPPPSDAPPPVPAPHRAQYFRHSGVHPFVDAAEDRLSTFGLDVDTGSWSLVQAYLRRGELPPAAAVRVEEVVNALDYGDPAPARGETFRVTAEGAPSPFAPGPDHRLLRFGIQARAIDPGERRPATLTFVVDVSGSMQQEGRLELVQEALGLLLDQLGPGDRVAVVAFSDEARVLLAHTADAPAARRAIATLAPERSTNAEAGLALGFHLAWRERRPGTANRVLLLSDGVANVGATEAESLLARAAGAAADGIELSTVGVGMGDYNDALLEQLADRGDGRYAYVGDVAAAHRVFVEEVAGTLETVAEEARVQVDFDPRVVASWRLLGYENRDLEDRRFRHDDTVDVGEIGAGHAVTALYEVRLVGQPPPGRALAHLKLRYRVPESERFSEIERLLRVGDLSPTWEAAPPSLRLAAVAAELAEQLRGSRWSEDTEAAELARYAAAVAAERPGDDRAAELAALAERAARLAERGRD